MESAFEFPRTLLLTSMLPIALALVSVAVLLLLRRKRQISPVWFVTAMCAAALIAPVAAVFFSARHVAQVFQSMAMMGGGIGAASAGIWEASHPLFFTLFAALLIVVIGVIAALMPDGAANGNEGKAGGGALPLVVLPLVSIALAFAPIALFHSTSGLMFDVVSPSFKGAGGPAGLATLAQKISSRLVLSTTMSLLATALLGGVIVLAVIAGRRPRPIVARGLAFLPLLLLAAFLLLQMVQLRSKMRVFKQTAITGQVPGSQVR